MESIRLYSWNVNGLRAVLKKNALQQFLADESPDILCLQEIKCKEGQLDLFESGALSKDYGAIWNSAEKAGYSGTMVLAKHSLETHLCDSDRVNSLVASFYEKVGLKEGRVLALEFDSFVLVDVYTPNSKPDLSRLSLREKIWDPAFLSLLKDLERETGKPVVTCGDFNAAHEEIDIARPKQNHHNAGFTDEERRGVTNIIEGGFVDTFRTVHPSEQRYTWWSHWGKARENNVGWRIDYFFVSKQMKERLINADIHEKVLGSDHCPISITFKLSK